MDVYGIIMAGGGGSRFWPLSRQATPKQLLNLTGKDLMVNETLDRMGLVIPGKNMYIVTNCTQAPAMEQAVHGRVLPGQILAEPAARNTAACIGYAAFEVLKKRGDGILCVAPSDAYIRDWPAFAGVLETAVKAAEQTNQLVTIGIQPTFPATGYGYIQYDAREQDAAHKVLQFKEKPDEATAKCYLAQGRYAWNSGMFIWKASVILEQYRRYLPQVYEPLERIANAMGTAEEHKVLREVYPTIPSISVDYGILERSSDVWMVNGDFGWNDVGSWDMLPVLHPADEQGNVTVGDCLTLDCENVIGYSSGRLVAAVGVKDLVVVETPDAVMVCDRNHAQDVKNIVEELKRQGRTELL